MLMNGDQISTTKMLVLPSIDVFILCHYRHRLKSFQVFRFSVESVTALLKRASVWGDTVSFWASIISR